MGLRLLPWLIGLRRKHKDPTLFDCESCVKRTTRQYRKSLNCGWIAPHERTGPGAFLAVPFKFPDPDVADQCPGWLVRLPQVREAQLAYLWSEKGQLKERYPHEDDLENVMDCIQILSSEQQKLENQELDELRSKK